MITKLSALSLAALLTGCVSSNTAELASKAYSEFISQQRSVENVTLKGDDMTITLTNVDELTVSSPVTPLSLKPRDPNVAETVARELGSVAKLGLGMHYGAKMVDTLAARPQVIEASVVQPEVIVVPAGE